MRLLGGTFSPEEVSLVTRVLKAAADCCLGNGEHRTKRHSWPHRSSCAQPPASVTPTGFWPRQSPRPAESSQVTYRRQDADCTNRAIG